MLLLQPYSSKWMELVALIRRARRRRNPLGIGKYILFMLVAPKATNLWLNAAVSHPVLKRGIGQHPLLFLKPFKPYLSNSYGVAQKVDVLLWHYSFLSYLPSETVAPLLNGKGILLCALEAKEGARFFLMLNRADYFDREGELLLTLKGVANDDRIACVAFSIDKEAGQWQIKIGCIQGGQKENSGKDITRHVTRQLHGIRPKNLIMDALYYLAEAFGITKIVGVDNAQQVKKAYSKRVFADYDAFWKELGATTPLEFAEGYLLPKTLEHKSPEQVPSAKRAEYRRRLGLRQDVQQQINAVFNASRPQ